MGNLVLIFIGAGLGAVFRYWVSNLIYAGFGKTFPYGTLIVNLSGCLLMGILFVLIMERMDGISLELRSFVLIGLLGGYTTYSTFSIETLMLIENGQWLGAGANILATTLLCMVATWIGVVGGRLL